MMISASALEEARELEQAIAKLIKDFEHNTSLRVEDVLVNRLTTVRKLGEESTTALVVEVELSE